MADAPSGPSLTAAQRAAYEMLRDRFGEESIKPLALTKVGKATASAGAVGWSVELADDHTGQRRELRIVLPGSFPLENLHAVVSPSAYPDWPHCGIDGELCLWPSGECADGDDPASHMQQALERVGRILHLVYRAPQAERVEHQQQEWLAYWPLPPSKGLPANAHGYVLSDPENGDGILSASCSDRGATQFVLIGGSEESRSRWHRALGVGERSIHQTSSLMVKLSQPPIGAPRNMAALRELLATENAAALRSLDRLLESPQAPKFVCFRVGSERRTYAGLRLLAIPNRKPLPYVHGARAKRAQREQRDIVGWHVDTMSVERADASWIHGRGFDAEADALRGKHVVVVGCGSLGGLVAQGLAHAGVGQLTLVDPEVLVAANLGRHVLSARHLQRKKVDALAEELLGQLPHLRVEGIAKRYQEFGLSKAGKRPDLIVSATADWPTDKLLMAQHAGGVIGPILLAWAEPHVIAGHSILAAHSDDRPIHLFDTAGEFLNAVTRWPTTRFPLPGCAGQHQPGTFGRLQKVSAMAVEQAVQYITGCQVQSQHRVTVGDELLLAKLGGTWKLPTNVSGGPRERIEAFPVPKDSLSA